MATTVEKARRDVSRARARLKRAELRAGVQERVSAAGDAVTTAVTDKVAPAVHDAFTDHVVPAVHDALTDHVMPVVRDTLTEKVVPTVRDTVLPAAQKAARRGAARSAKASRAAAERIAETEAAQEARRRAEEVIAAATGKAPRTRRRWPLAVALVAAGAAAAQRYAQRARSGLPTAGPAADLRVPGSSSGTGVDLTASERTAAHENPKG